MSTTTVPPRYPEFGRLVEEHLERSGLTQKQVGKRVGVTQQQIGHYKAGSNAPRGGRLSRLVDVLDMDAAEVLQALEDSGAWLTRTLLAAA